MTYLELCQMVASKMGVTEPTTVVAQTGDAKRIVNWVKEAWLEIQSIGAVGQDHGSWKFLWGRTEFDTVAGTDEYSVSGIDVAKWDVDSFTIYLKSDGESKESRLSTMLYEDFKRINTGVDTNAKPSRLVVLPSGNLMLDPTPDAVYTIQGDYWLNPVALAADADVPACAAHHHYAIVNKALSYYYDFDEQLQSVQIEESRFQQKLSRLMQAEMTEVFLTVIPE